MSCLAIIDMGKIEIAQLVVPNSEQTVSVPFDKTNGEKADFEPGKDYVLSFEEAPLIAKPIADDQNGMKAEK